MKILRCFTVDACYKATRIANGLFFALFILSLPVYFFVYYFLFVGYMTYEGHVHLLDSLYCVSYCMWRCAGAITLGNCLMAATYFTINLFSPYYLAKCAAYLISILTLPGLLLIVYLSICGITGNIWNNVSRIIYGSTSFLLGGVLISLIPPFCRRRAHTLAGILLFGMNACKMAIKTIIWDVPHLMFVPFMSSAICLAVLRVHRVYMTSIHISERAHVLHRLLPIGLGAANRAYFTHVVFRNIFKIGSAKPTRWQCSVLALGSLLYCSVGTITSTEYPGQGTIFNGAISIAFYLARMAFSYWIPYMILLMAQAFMKAEVRSKLCWLTQNRMHFVYFEVCRYIVMIFMIFLPFCVTYYIFERNHGESTSEISITLSFMRMAFAHVFSGLEGALIIIYIGQRLSLPQRAPKRVTYSDIIHIYRPVISAIVHPK
ncbi:uncharacterized protein NEMAJ01_1420 [Nematocida major]|uniref:uncharacterized protein n=1 Tax=Nematocida major TaxID=1912982 RepID=UPI002007559C|nr:uncharacterized protein NEMAJ01_1420 [Nematocida major]KAH9386524.1 hypothetical protein NEMAJ01_1420 [Nematocida major]